MVAFLMPPYRKTAIVELALPSAKNVGSLPLTCDREYGVYVVVEDRKLPAQSFQSPINDEQWRQFLRQLRDCNTIHDTTGYNSARAIRALGRELCDVLGRLSPALAEFLGRTGVARRLVIQTDRPELHLLPWGGMNDREGKLLAAGDLSIVQAWDRWEDTPLATGGRLRLVTVLGETQQASAAGLELLPPEIVAVEDGTDAFAAGRTISGIDMLHLEEHGNAVLNEVADVQATKLPTIFERPKIALLWSCYSGSANSWGQSPALCLHREGAGLVLSFLAELHNLDARSIAQAFYADVFGPAASRDPESALVRIRAQKFSKEFEFANWASMSLYLRRPLDLSAIALNGPRVPEADWTDIAETSEIFWNGVSERVRQLQPGMVHGIDAALKKISELPRDAFKAWRGNVVHLDGCENPLSREVVRELNLSEDKATKGHPADRLMWFFTQIARYGAPLIVWTNASPRHATFLKAIGPPATLTFLLLYGAEEPASVAKLVQQNRIAEAKVACAALAEDCGDEELSAAYFAFARDENKEQAEIYLGRVRNSAERLLLQGNFMSRTGRVAGGTGKTLSKLEQQQYQEDCYRQVMDAPGDESPLRDAGRGKHELAYLLSCMGNTGAAEILYRLALEDLERSPSGDTRWHGTLGKVLRDWADLLSDRVERLEEARGLLLRAMAIHAFHGCELEIAYSTTTAARIAHTACRHEEAIELAVDAANRFEQCKNWRGWKTAMKVLFRVLAETRQTRRMLGVVELAVEKLRGSNLSQDQRDALLLEFSYVKAEAHWIAGELTEAREELRALRLAVPADGVESELHQKIERMEMFLTI